MKQPGESLLLLFDWIVPFFERALPKSNPKIPSPTLWGKAAVLAYDTDPDAVPTRFTGDIPKGTPKVERRRYITYRIAKFGLKHTSQIELYMMEEYNQMVVFFDGDFTSKGKRIVTNSERASNLDAVRFQGAWNSAHCNGTHSREDFVAEQINRIQPKADLERHKLVNLPLPKPKGGK